SLVVIQLIQDTDELTVIEGNTYFLWLEIDATGIQPFENDVNATLIFRWFVLSNDSRVDNAIIKPPSVFRVQIFVSPLCEPFLNILESVLCPTDDAFIKGTQGEKALMAVKNQENTRWLFDQKNSWNRKPKQ